MFLLIDDICRTSLNVVSLFSLHRSSQLLKRFAMSGEQSVDFLSRLLEFDPRRRATAEEAQSHEYFDNLKELFEVSAVSSTLMFLG